MIDLAALLRRPSVIAVVGATDSPHKYGNTIYRDLKRKGFEVRAVNPNRETVDGDPSYPSVADVPDEIDLVDLVVPPTVSRRIIDEMAANGLGTVWFQPGSESADAIAAAEAAGMHVISRACIMTETFPLDRSD